MVQPGKYEATVADYGAGETSTGKPYVYAYFNVDGGSVKWTGYLSEKAIEKTMEQLTYLGCKDFVSIADGATGGALDQSVKVSITVEHEADQKDPKKIYAKVKWINRIGGKKTMDAAQITQAKTTLAAFQGQFLAAQQKSGSTTVKKTLGF